MKYLLPFTCVSITSMAVPATPSHLNTKYHPTLTPTNSVFLYHIESLAIFTPPAESCGAEYIDEPAA